MAALVFAALGGACEGGGEFTLKSRESHAPVAIIMPGENIQDFVNEYPEGTTFHIQSGIHREQTVAPKEGHRFIGEGGAILSGAKLLTSFSRQGRLWYAERQTQQGPSSADAACEPGVVRCGYVEDLFIDGKPLMHEGSLLAVGPGEWYFDYSKDRIYFADDPTDKKIETSVLQHAFLNTADNVTIENLIIEMYSSPAQAGAIHGDDTANWTLRNNKIRLNHGTGVRMGRGWLVEKNKIIRNGQLGIAGYQVDGSRVIGNEIAYNNFARYAPAWEAGGTKWVATSGLLIQKNYSHDNGGPGLWTDSDNINITYDGNRVENNSSFGGIFHELSCDAVIKNNILKGNSRNDVKWLYGAGILLSTSKNTEVYNNYVEADNANGITMIQQDRTGEAEIWNGNCGPRSARITANNEVHDNSVYKIGDGGISGAAADWNGNAMWMGGNIFNENAYCVADINNWHWAWVGEKDWSGFRAQGHEANGQAFNHKDPKCLEMKVNSGLTHQKPN